MPRLVAVWAALAVCMALPLSTAQAAAAQSTQNNPTAGCEAVSNKNIDPPANAEALFTLQSVGGTRNFTCKSGAVSGSLYMGAADLVGDEFSGEFYYTPANIPVYNLHNTSGGQEGDVIVEAAPLSEYETPPEGVSPLPWGRGKIVKVTGTLPVVSYVVRSDTQSEPFPKACDAAPGEWVLVPYNATYTFYACP